MRIAIDGRKLIGNRTGIGNYLLGILQELFMLDPKNEYFIFVDEKPDIEFKNINVTYIEVRFLKNLIKSEKVYSILWLNVFIIPVLIMKRISLFWGPNFLKPLLFPNKKSIVTIHDLAFIKNKDDHSKIHAIYLRNYLKLCVNKNLNILTVSEYSKKDILEEFNVLDNKVKVTYCALDLNEKLSLEKPLVKLPEEYSLFVGTLEKRKNLILVLNSISYSIKNNLNVVPLVIVGAKGNGMEQIKKLVTELKIERYVYFTGYIKDEELAYIYKNAKIFIFPSLYEGFGIPLLEAMRSEVPIICSNTTSLPEVAKDAAIYIDPRSIQELSNAVNNIILDQKLRYDLVLNGNKRLRFFSWKKGAQTLLNIINKLEGELK